MILQQSQCFLRLERPGDTLRSGLRFELCLGVEKVGVHKAGEQHPRVERLGEAVVHRTTREAGQLNAIAFPLPIEQFEGGFNTAGPFLPGFLVGSALDCLLETFVAIQGRDARMVSVHGESNGQLLQCLASVCGTCGPVVDVVNRVVVQAGLKASGVFAQVMQQPSQPSFISETQWLGKPFRQLRDIPQVRGQQLPLRRIQVWRPVRPHCGMRVILHFVLRFPSDPDATVVALPPPADKRFLCAKATMGRRMKEEG